ncbi:MAG: HypC/HybG/HupF family hydrogenase formation chaperone [Fuerstiella sp.]
MCLGVPGRVVEWVDRDPTFAKAKIEFGGVARVCSMACVPDAEVGEYVVVHAGIAISRIDEVAARLALEELKEFGLAEELEEIRDSMAGNQ